MQWTRSEAATALVEAEARRLAVEVLAQETAEEPTPAIDWDAVYRRLEEDL